MTDHEWFNSENGINAITTVLIAAIVVLVVITAIIFGYYFFYKRRINKALKSDGEVKTPSITPGGTAVTTLVITGIASTILMFLMLTAIMVHVTNSDMRGYVTFEQVDNIYNNQHSVFSTLIDIENKVDSHNISNNVKMSLGKYNKEDNTVNVKVELVPRLVLGKKDKLTLSIGDSVAELKRDKDEFYRGEVRIPTYAVETAGLLKLETNGTVLTQIISDSELGLNNEWSDDWEKYYPYVDCSLANINDYDGEMSADVRIYPYSAKSDENRKFTELSLIFETDEKVLRTVDLMNDRSVLQEDGGYVYYLKENISNRDKAVIARVEGKDNLGYSYNIEMCCLREGTYDKISENAESGDEVFFVYDPQNVMVIHSSVNPATFD